ncbi:MAG: hypothetical protein HC915_10285 [Anaerolineae bacterium]|nr:hypothetical protein [Anaerolineae bacterium]
MALRHTEFMQRLAQRLPELLDSALGSYQWGETRWLCQIAFAQDRRLHYEVSRPYNRTGRVLEIGLHAETRSSTYNYQLLAALDRHLFEIRAQLGDGVHAEVWDRGWTKLYELHPDEPLTEAWLGEVAARYARFITIVQPIVQNITGEEEA